jgi:hypothetical protein
MLEKILQDERVSYIRVEDLSRVFDDQQGFEIKFEYAIPTNQILSSGKTDWEVLHTKITKETLNEACEAVLEYLENLPAIIIKEKTNNILKN